MSVKSKVKRCNKEIERLELKVKDLEIQNNNLRENILRRFLQFNDYLTI